VIKVGGASEVEVGELKDKFKMHSAQPVQQVMKVLFQVVAQPFFTPAENSRP